MKYTFKEMEDARKLADNNRYLNDRLSLIEDMVKTNNTLNKKNEKLEQKVKELEENSLENLAEMCENKYDFRIDFECKRGEFNFRLFESGEEEPFEKLDIYCDTIQDCVKEAIIFLKEQSET